MNSEKRKRMAQGIFADGIFVYVIGCIYSLVASMKVEEHYYGEDTISFDFSIFMEKAFLTFALGSIILGIAYVIYCLDDICERQIVPTSKKTKAVKKSVEDVEVKSEGTESYESILFELLKNGNITKEEYDTAIANKEKNDN